MTSKQLEKKISVDQLQVGLFINLEGHWLQHPFLLNNFMIKNEKQIATIKALGIREIIYLPEKSERNPLPHRKDISPEPLSPPPSSKQDSPELALKRERIARLQKLKKRIARTAQKFSQTADQVPNLMSTLLAGSKEGAQGAQDLVNEMVQTFIEVPDSVMHLIDAEDNDQESTYHFLNVAVLALMLGNALQLPPEKLQLLGMGAFLHDIGKMRIDKKYWRKSKRLMNKHEIELLKIHPQYGMEVAGKAGIQDKMVLSIIAQHHERCDALGYPAGLRAPKIHILAKITTIANIFDNLCNHYDPQKRLPPHTALQLMFKEYDTIIDMNIFAFFRKKIGIYPPGSIVQLNTDDWGKVMAVNPNLPLQPMIMPYAKGIPTKDAPLIDLAQEEDIYIKRAVNPEDLPTNVLKYLKPKDRISFFMEQAEEQP